MVKEALMTIQQHLTHICRSRRLDPHIVMVLLSTSRSISNGDAEEGKHLLHSWHV